MMHKLSARALRPSAALLFGIIFSYAVVAQELPNNFETEEGYTLGYPANHAVGGGFGAYSITNNAGDTYTFTFGSGVAIESSIEINTAEDVLAQLKVLLSFVGLEVLETNDIMLGDTPAIVARTSGMISDQFYILYKLPDGTGAWTQISSRANDVNDLLDTGIAIAASTVGTTGTLAETDGTDELPVIDVENAIINLPIGVSFNYPEEANLALPAPDDDTKFDNQVMLSSIMEPGTYTVDFTQNSKSDEIENINQVATRNGGTPSENVVKEVISVNDNQYTAYIMTVNNIYRVVILQEVVPDSVVVISGQAIGDFEPEQLKLILERTALIASTVRLRDAFIAEIDNVPTMIESVSCSAETTFYLSTEKPAIALNCPANCIDGFVAGTDVYVGDAALCVAAIHAGVSTIEGGGSFIVRRADGKANYVGSSRNGIQSIDFAGYDFSIIFKAIEE